MHSETILAAPVPPPHPADSFVPSGDPPAPRPWCPDGPQAEVVALGDRIAELSARIQAATWELLELIRRFDERNGWAPCVSCAEWLGWRTGLAPGAAREHVRVARALADLPKLSDAMRRGKVSYSKMRAITRVATAETEDRTDAHHVEHWAAGGRTALDNLVLLCRRHHRAVHEEGFRITLDAAGDVEFIRPDGRPLPEAPAAPVWTDPPLAPVTARLERAGVPIDPDTLTPDWRGERLDLDWAIHVLWRPRSQAEAGTDGGAGEDAGQPVPVVSSQPGSRR